MIEIFTIIYKLCLEIEFSSLHAFRNYTISILLCTSYTSNGYCLATVDEVFQTDETCMNKTSNTVAYSIHKNKHKLVIIL